MPKGLFVCLRLDNRAGAPVRLQALHRGEWCDVGAEVPDGGRTEGPWVPRGLRLRLACELWPPRDCGEAGCLGPTLLVE